MEGIELWLNADDLTIEDILNKTGKFDSHKLLDSPPTWPWKVRPLENRLDNDATELNILGHFLTLWDTLVEDFTKSWEHLDYFSSHFRPFSPITGSLKNKEYKPTEQRTDGQTNGQADPVIKMRGCI